MSSLNMREVICIMADDLSLRINQEQHIVLFDYQKAILNRMMFLDGLPKINKKVDEKVDWKKEGF